MKPIRKIHIGLAVAAFSVTLLVSSAIAVAAPTFNRPINESTHVANAIALSTTAYPSGAPAAVVTSADSYADSLTAAVLARAYSGPLLLASGASMGSNVAAELTRLHPAKVFLVGLPASFVGSVTSSVSGLTADKVRVIKGADRYETAALVARAVGEKTGSVSKVVIAPGDSYGAALAAASLAAAQQWPLLLMPKAGPLPASAQQAITALGVSSGVEVGTDALLGIDGFTVTKRIVGTATATDSDGRYDTAAKLAEYAQDQGWLSFARVGIVAGDDYPDGEIAAAYLAKYKGVLLFSKATALQAATGATLRSRGRLVTRVDIVGLGWAVYREVKSLNSPRVTALSAGNGPTGGGNKLVLTGAQLDKATKVRVGKVDVPSAGWRADSATQITISSVPAGFGDGPVEVIVSDYWGASPSTTKDLYWYGSGAGATAGEKVVKKAVEYLGVPYLWAGSNPTTGMDCSGFCMYVYKQFGISLPHYSRAMSTLGTAVSKADLRPGDLIFFYTPIQHVGMYVGGGLMINAPRSGDLVCIEDAFRSSYVNARRFVSSGPATSHFEQSDQRLAFAGAWSNSNTSLASGGSFAYADTTGSTVTIAFNGTYLGLIAKKSPLYGIAKVTVDGGTPHLVDLYNPETAYLQKAWNTGTLASGSHKVVIQWTGTKNAQATGHNISIDSIDVIGTLTQATASTTPGIGNSAAVRYEETDSHIGWAGAWKGFSTTGASSGSYQRACTTGATATVTFKGTYFAWIATRGTTLGTAKVSLDGGTARTVDLAASPVAYQQKVWETGTLANANHTVIISWDTGNIAGKYISVDAIEISGTLTTAPGSSAPAAPAAPATTRYEQKDARFAFAGGWIASSSDQASGASFRYANVVSSATVSFNGTYLAWVGKKGPEYGLAKVSLDAKAPVTVDLFAQASTWQQKLWDTGVLPSGDHVVKIDWTGAKNANGMAANINVDAFEIAGTVTQAPSAASVRYEQGDTHLTYAGAWTTSSTGSASGGSFSFADARGSSVKATFVGSSLAWITKRSPKYGLAKVVLDGGTPVTIDLYGASEAFKQKVWETGRLVPGTHTVLIEWTGDKNAKATDYNIGVDAFDVVGVLQ